MPRTKKDSVHFTLPDDLPTESKNTGKPYSDFTMKLYRQKLDKLALGGIPDVVSLAQNQDKAIDIAKQDSGGDQAKMRVHLSAMFYALSNLPNESKTKIYNEFQKNRSEVYPTNK